ncbi:glutathione S-transferase [Lophiotrema nucula]|uniref:Glutathione S-transferase n=1 Tax=Lophiotrema nucula TaxID=690887 RepID=A0A6A5YJQ4_9PLEO|nr:glutathione S-transferase [Lophiotrema nucula]
MPSLTVHHLQVGQGERVPWLLEELNIPYELKLHQRNPLFSPPDLKALHPMGASPVLEDATGNTEKPLILGESGAIVEYIINKYGDGRLALKPDHPNYADYLYWFHFSNSNFQGVIGRVMTVYGVTQDSSNLRVKTVEDRLHVALAHFNKRVAENTWLAGDEFTAADVMSVFSFTTMRKFQNFDLSQYQGILDWLKRCTDRPAYRTAMKKGDPELDIEELISPKGPAKFEGFAKMVALLQQKKKKL